MLKYKDMISEYSRKKGNKKYSFYLKNQHKWSKITHFFEIMDEIHVFFNSKLSLFRIACFSGILFWTFRDSIMLWNASWLIALSIQKFRVSLSLTSSVVFSLFDSKSFSQKGQDRRNFAVRIELNTKMRIICLPIIVLLIRITCSGGWIILPLLDNLRKLGKPSLFSNYTRTRGPNFGQKSIAKANLFLK